MKRFVAVAFLLALGIASDAEARRKSLAFFPPRPERLRAFRYASQTGEQCLAEARVRKLPFSLGKAKKNQRIETPVHLDGPLHGVSFEHAYPSRLEKGKGPIMDCRLLLALDDFATVAGDRGIAAIRYNSIWRRGWTKKGARHPSGVAIDVVELVKKGGEKLNVLDDFGGSGIGSKTCGEEAPAAPPGKAAELRALVCALHDASIFNLILTPHYDRRHKDHLHLEVRRGIKWFLTQ